MAQLTCENVSLGYDNKTILSNLSFSVNSGDYLCIVGENGSGKSTLMRTMLGLQKPMSGEISLGCYRELSGGQQQRVLLARALCATQKILLLDEPVSGLDPKVTAEMYELISGLNKEGITIIMISHDIDVAISEASHILHICDKPFFGTKEEYLKSELGSKFIEQGEK